MASKIGNLFYFKHIQSIGGTETFLYEIAKKYSNKHDIVIYYDTCSTIQLERLNKYVDCRKHIKGKKIECEKHFLTTTLILLMI